MEEAEEAQSIAVLLHTCKRSLEFLGTNTFFFVSSHGKAERRIQATVPTKRCRRRNVTAHTVFLCSLIHQLMQWSPETSPWLWLLVCLYTCVCVSSRFWRRYNLGWNNRGWNELYVLRYRCTIKVFMWSLRYYTLFSILHLWLFYTSATIQVTNVALKF